MQMTIDADFSKLISPLLPEEYRKLQENIVRDGCRDPLVTWQGILLDGHNRYRICRERSLPFQSVEIDLPDREAAADWIDANQLGRRNLAPDQMSLLRGRRYNRLKKAHGGTGANQHTKQRAQNGPSATAEKLAQEHGVSRNTIKRDGQFADAIEKVKAVSPTIEQDVAMASRRGAAYAAPDAMSERTRRTSRSYIACPTGTKDGAFADGTGRPTTCGTTGEKSDTFTEANCQ